MLKIFSKDKRYWQRHPISCLPSLLKEWAADSLGVLQEDMMQELLTGITTQNYLYFTLPHPIILNHSQLPPISTKNISSRPCL